MAHTKFRVEVLTPEGQVFDDEVEQVSTMTAVGSIGILAGHQPLLGMAEPAPLRLYRSETDVVTLAQGEGYIQVSSEGEVLILVEEAIPPSDLNAGELRDHIKQADRVCPAPPRIPRSTAWPSVTSAAGKPSSVSPGAEEVSNAARWPLVAGPAWVRSSPAIAFATRVASRPE